jgi:hypothetical protein
MARPFSFGWPFCCVTHGRSADRAGCGFARGQSPRPLRPRLSITLCICGARPAQVATEASYIRCFASFSIYRMEVGRAGA